MALFLRHFFIVFNGTTATPGSCSSVASWAVFPHNWVGFFVALRDFFCCCGLRFFGLVLSKCLLFFGLVFRKIFLSRSIVFVNSTEVVRFIFTLSNVIAGFSHSFLFS